MSTCDRPSTPMTRTKMVKRAEKACRLVCRVTMARMFHSHLKNTTEIPWLCRRKNRTTRKRWPSCVERCFNRSHSLARTRRQVNPQSRPSPLQWHDWWTRTMSLVQTTARMMILTTSSMRRRSPIEPAFKRNNDSRAGNPSALSFHGRSSTHRGSGEGSGSHITFALRMHRSISQRLARVYPSHPGPPSLLESSVASLLPAPPPTPNAHIINHDLVGHRCFNPSSEYRASMS